MIPLRARFLVILLCVIVGSTLPVLLDLLAPPSFMEDMPGGPYRAEGLFNPPDNVSGFYIPETAPDGTTYRWTTEHATLTFPYAANMGRFVRVVMRLAADRGADQSPAKVALSINNKEYPAIEVPRSFEIVTATLDIRQSPNPYINPSHVQIDLRTSTVSAPGDPRQLGVAVDWIRLDLEPSRREIATEAAVWGLFVLLVLLVAIPRLGLARGTVFGLVALASFVLIHLTAAPRAISPAVEVALAGLAWLLAALLAPPTRGNLAIVLALALAGLGLWLALAGRPLGDWQIDDAYISYRYAWNLVHGNGLIYNPGEVVEGYTNFLWTMLAAGALALGWSPDGVMLAANIALSQCLLALTFYVGCRLADNFGFWILDFGRHRSKIQNPKSKIQYICPLAAAVLVAVDADLITYGARGSGIEAVAFGLLVLLSVSLLWTGDAAADRKWRALGGAALALASLTRPEGILVVGLLLAVRAWQDRRSARPWSRLLLTALVPYLTIVVPYHAWRVSFYGYPFPNTFYAKTGATLSVIGRGLEYAWQFAGHHWLIVLGLAGGLALSLTRLLALVNRFWRRASGAERPELTIASRLQNPKSKIQNRNMASELRWGLVALTGVYSAYIVAIGGDWFPAERFFVPVLAPLILLAVEATRLVFERLAVHRLMRQIAFAIVIIASVSYLGFAFWLQSPTENLAVQTNRHATYIDRWGMEGAWLRDNTPPNTLLAVKAAGAMVYYSQRRAVDMFGLTDSHIAHLDVGDMGSKVAGHDKADPAYVLSRKPDYILDSWADYFDPVHSRFTNEYGIEKVQGPIGREIYWLHRKGGLGP